MTNEAGLELDQLLAKPIETLSTEKAFEIIGLIIDLSGDLKCENGTLCALDYIEKVLKRELRPDQAALLEYFCANAWANLQRIRHVHSRVWEWEQPELLRQVLHLRRAVGHPGYLSLETSRRCQIQTNLGNQLSTIGRFVEAQEPWNLALQLIPRFAMALGNRGRALLQYAHSLYDQGHAVLFLAVAHRSLNAAIAPNAIYEGADHAEVRSYFSSAKTYIEKLVDVGVVDISPEYMNSFSLGSSKVERQYREWALRECLFVNPLNDLGPYSIAATDVFTLPNFTTAIGESPTLVGLFNQLKQEFVSARWLLFEGLHAERPHFSDRDVLLYNTLDYPSYSLAVEKTKAAYRIVYSLFDKIAFFLNDYAKLGVNPRGIYFRNIWYVNGDMKGRLVRPEFSWLENWPLRGLFWLAKDFVEPELQDVMEPDARALYVIRNCLEHSYLKVHEMLVKRQDERFCDPWIDRLAYSVQRKEFEEKTVGLFKLARAAMIYLSLGMRSEERRRDGGDEQKLVGPMPLFAWSDEFKR